MSNSQQVCVFEQWMMCWWTEKHLQLTSTQRRWVVTFRLNMNPMLTYTTCDKWITCEIYGITCET